MSDGGPGGWRKKRFGILVIACFFPVLPDYLFFFFCLIYFCGSHDLLRSSISWISVLRRDCGLGIVNGGSVVPYASNLICLP